MTDLDAVRFDLAVEAVAAAFTVIARHTMSSGTMEIIDMNHRIRVLRHGDEGLLRRTLYSLCTLAGSQRFLAFRSVATALAKSLPRACSEWATSRDLHIAVSDLRRLANEAGSLSAPDVAIKLAEIIDVLVGQDGELRTPTATDSVH